MTDRPIIFSAPMIKALLENRKTMTRRYAWRRNGQDDAELFPTVWQRAQVGDRLWVRENLTQRKGIFPGLEQSHMVAAYAADDTDVVNARGHKPVPWWRGKGGLPSIYMPRRFSRLTLIITATRIEQVREISDADAVAEGVLGRDAAHPAEGQHRRRYEELWKGLNGEESWDANPEVVALTLTVHKQNIDAMKEAA